jgi:hypothetical protein
MSSMRRWPLLGALAAAAAVAGVIASGGSAPPESATAAPSGPRVIGHSALGRAIRAIPLGDSSSPIAVLVVGCVHGTEPAGEAVIAALRRARPVPGVALWLIDEANPDGCLAGTRQNARGVDLNRNFPFRWRPLPSETYYSGPRPLSEPESRALYRFMSRLRPVASIWYHQHADLVDVDGDEATARRYARRAGMRFKRFYFAPGSITLWQSHAIAGSTGLVVELPAGRMSAAAVRRHANAVLALARDAAEAAAIPSVQAASVARPPIVQRPIPYGPKRRADMAAYSLRHYGRREWRLTPRAIVTHWTGSDSFRSAYESFVPNRPDPELHQLPGVCAHFVIARDGTIFQHVDTGIRCRHAFGMNHVAIGIEHVGRSDAEVMGNPRQLAASMKLVRWLACRYGIAVRDVVGHAETLGSRWYTEIHPKPGSRWTHGDMGRRAMTRYRDALRPLRCG